MQGPSAHFPGCRCCARGPGVFRLQSSWLTMQAEQSTTNFDRLFKYYKVKCDNARKFDWAGPLRNVVRVGLDCSRGMERKVLVLAAHCVLKQSSDIAASPGTMLAPALLAKREQQQQHFLTPASAKAAPAQCHAHHCSICGAVRHTHRGEHTHTHTHTLTRMCFCEFHM